MARVTNILLCLLALSAMLAVGGCDGGGGGGEFSVWVAGDMTGLTVASAPAPGGDVYHSQTHTIRLFAAANESVSFQLVVDAGELPCRNVRLTFGDLALKRRRDGAFDQAAAPNQAIRAENIRAFRMLPIRVDSYPPWYLRMTDRPPAKADIYDPLVPIDADSPAGQPFQLSPQERLAVWVDVDVPRGAVPGVYEGNVSVSSGGEQTWTGRVSLRVYDFVLPDARPIAAVGGFDHRTIFRQFVRRNGEPYVPVHLDRKRPLIREGLVIVRQLMRLAHAHRLDLFDRRIRPTLKRGRLGAIRLEWDNYDAIVSPYLSGSAFADHVGVAAWPMPFSQDWPARARYGEFAAEDYERTARSVLQLCREHFEQTPALSDRLFHWPVRNPTGYGQYMRPAALIRSADTRTPILTTLPPSPPAPTGWRAPRGFMQLADMFAPAGEWFDPDLGGRMSSEAHPLAGLWLSPGQPPYLPNLGVIASPADARALPWFAVKYRCRGLFLPEVLNWSGELTAGPAGAQTRLFYPGTIAGLDEVLPSVRLKRLRRGLLDAAYLSLLKDRQRMGVAMAATNAMVRYAGQVAGGDHYLDPRLDGWTTDGESWRMLRRLLAEEIQTLVHPTTATAEITHAAKIAWLHFDQQFSGARVERVRTRIEPTDAGDASAGLTATIVLDVFNELSRSAEVTATLDKLPDGWRVRRGRSKLPALPPARRAVIELSAEGSKIPATIDGKLPISLTVSTGAEPGRQITAYLPMLVAGRPLRRPTIDGDLHDWPMRARNSAGRFRLLGRRGQIGNGQAARQTFAWVLADAKNLYISIRCKEPNLSAMVARRNNSLNYEQLMLTGEDLVELIFDPGQSAEAPEDLYHLVVKANGIAVAERGVRSEFPLGRVRPWSAQANVAVANEKDAWVVELAIPRSAFGVEGDKAMWGINFTRFATQGGEASSWSGAARYFYDPRNLGAIRLPPGEEKDATVE